MDHDTAMMKILGGLAIPGAADDWPLARAIGCLETTLDEQQARTACDATAFDNVRSLEAALHEIHTERTLLFHYALATQLGVDCAEASARAYGNICRLVGHERVLLKDAQPPAPGPQALLAQKDAFLEELMRRGSAFKGQGQLLASVAIVAAPTMRRS